MKKKLLTALLIVFTSFIMTGCCLVHDWEEATCTAPRTCKDCGKTDGGPLEHEFKAATCVEPRACIHCGYAEGDPMGHIWSRSSCTTPRTCTVCGAVDGDVAEHTWIEATCVMPRHCSVCGVTDGTTMGHQWMPANYNNPRTCAVCGATEGSSLSSYAEGPFANISYNLTNGSKQNYSTITGVDDRISNGTVTVESYTKYAEDPTHPYKEGYEWREVKVKFSMDKPSRVMWGYTDIYLGLNEYAKTDYITYADGTREKVEATQSFQSEIILPPVTPTQAPTQAPEPTQAPTLSASSTQASASPAPITAPQITPSPTPTPVPTPESEPDKYISYVSQAVQVPIRYKGLIFYVCNADYEIDHIIDDSFIYMKMD